MGGAAAVNVITMNTEAHVGDDATVTAGSGITVKATDRLKIFSAAGGLGASGGNTGVGIAIDVNVVTRDTRAWVGNRSDLVTTGGNIDLMAISDDDFDNFAATFGLSAGGTGVALSIEVVVVTSGTRAFVEAGTGANSSTLSAAGGNVTVKAQSTFDSFLLGGGVAVGLGGAGVGIASTVLVHHDTVDASIGNHSDVVTGGAIGLLVDAYSTDAFDDFAVAGGISGGSVGIGASVLVTVLTEITTASVGTDVEIDAYSAGGNKPGVTVKSFSQTDLISVAGGIAISSSTAIGGGVSVHTLTKTTTATIGAGTRIYGDTDRANPDPSTEENAEGNVIVTATSLEDMRPSRWPPPRQEVLRWEQEPTSMSSPSPPRRRSTAAAATSRMCGRRVASSFKPSTRPRST